MGDGDVLPLCIALTHKPNRKIHFPNTYGAGFIDIYVVENSGFLSAMTADTYSYLQQIFVSLLEHPMR
jgi:hypothetical protein